MFDLSIIIQKLINQQFIDCSNFIDEDWKVLINFLKKNKLLALFYSKTNTNNIPISYREIFTQRLLLNTLLKSEGERISKKIFDLNIKCVPLKGWTLAENSVENRDYNDIDILVDSNKIETVIENLSGYIPKARVSFLAAVINKFISHSIELSSKLDCELDLHYRVAERYHVGVDFSKGLFESAVITNKMYKVSAEYNFIYLCIHAYKNSWSILGDIIDCKNQYILCDLKQLDLLTKKYNLNKVVSKTISIISSNSFLSSEEYHEDYYLICNYRENLIDKVWSLIIRYCIPFGKALNNKNDLDVILAVAIKIPKDIFKVFLR